MCATPRSAPRNVSTVTTAKITFDARKNDTNIRDRGLPFGRAAEFDFETAVFSQDQRRD